MTGFAPVGAPLRSETVARSLEFGVLLRPSSVKTVHTTAASNQGTGRDAKGGIQMDDIEISRRQVLATVGTAGGAGALTGTGTAALLSDELSFENSVTAGAIDLRVDWDVDGDGSGTSEGTATIDVDLTEENRTGRATLDAVLPDDGSNNPAYGWMRLACPEITELVTELDVDLYYECGDRTESLVPDTAETLCEVANALRNGIPLDPRCITDVQLGDQQCLQPGDPVRIVLEWELGENYEGDDQTSLEFSFFGRQCRHRDGTDDPYPEVPECDCPTGPAISWVAFCAEDGTSFTADQFEFDVAVDTLYLKSAPDNLDTVVLKYASYIRVFENPSVPGTYETDRDSSLDNVYEQQGNGYKGTNRTNSDPCPDGCGIKFEGDDDFETAESKGCSQ